MADAASAQLAPGALLPPHVLHYHLHRIKEARRTAAVPSGTCNPVPPVLALATAKACDPALWFVLDEFADASGRFLSICGKETCANSTMNVRDTHGGNTHQFAARPEQAVHFRTVLRNSVLPTPPVRRVCEIGFNAGHSAALWLEGTQSQVEHVVSFDMLDHPYSAAMQQLLTALYGEQRISWHGGDSTKTVAAFAARVASGEEPPCDLWYIDGGHGPVVAADTVNALKSSYNGTIVLWDDCTRKWKSPLEAYRSQLAAGTIRHSTALPTKIYMKASGNGFCAALANVSRTRPSLRNR